MGQLECMSAPLHLSVEHNKKKLSGKAYKEIKGYIRKADQDGDGKVDEAENDQYVKEKSLSTEARNFIESYLNISNCSPKSVLVR